MTQIASYEDEDLVRLYLNDVGRFALLSYDDEVRLAQEIEIGSLAQQRLNSAEALPPIDVLEFEGVVRQGQVAHRTFVQSNLRLVLSIAKKYRPSGLSLLDRVQDGNLGLIQAVEKFDWRKGFRFSTYATWWIRQAITRGIANTGRAIRLPVHAGQALARIQTTRSLLEVRLRRHATLTELAAELDLPESKVTDVLRFAAAPLSLNEPAGADSDVELAELIEENDRVSAQDAALLSLLPAEISCLLDVLDKREREIISLRFGLDRGEPRTLEEVGAHFNLTRERIRQLEARAMSKLRSPDCDETVRSLLYA